MNGQWKRSIDTDDYPKTWLTFQAKDIDGSDNLAEYVIKDITPEQHEDAVKYMLANFSDNEPTCQNAGVKNDPQSVLDIQEFWRSALVQNMSIGCFKRDGKDIIGMNVLHVKFKDGNDEYDVEYTGKAFSRSVGAVHFVSTQFDPFEFYKVDKCLNAMGLSVNFKYSGRGIAQKLLEAREPMCKYFDIPITTTAFTSDASQYCATKAKFEDNYEITYDELAKVDPPFIFPNIKHKSIKVMSIDYRKKK